MSKLKEWIDRIKATDDRKYIKITGLMVLLLVGLVIFQIVNDWTTRQAIETGRLSSAYFEESNKVEIARQRDMLALEKERKDLGLADNHAALEKLGDLFLRVGPLAILFFSLAQAWKIFEDPRSSRLRLALAVCFSVAVVGFVLIVGGYSAPTSLEIGFKGAQTQVSSESLGIVVLAVSGFMFLVSLAILKSKKIKQPDDEA
ncbi:MAG: hypothetical protein WC073_00925 [Sterolibacterium sp.]